MPDGRILAPPSGLHCADHDFSGIYPDASGQRGFAPQGDSHFIEVEYLFDLSALGIVPTFTGDQQQLSNMMIAYWTNFAKTGNPNAAELPAWPQFVDGGSLESLVAPTPVSQTDASFDADHKCSSSWNTF